MQHFEDFILFLSKKLFNTRDFIVFKNNNKNNLHGIFPI